MVKFTLNELRDLIISVLVFVLAIGILFRDSVGNDYSLLIFAALVGIVPGFVLHELAHKFMAIRYGFDAEFKMSIPGLFVALASSFFGIMIAAPGAVYINGEREISDKESGKIAIVGPMVNIVLALIFSLVVIMTIITAISAKFNGSFDGFMSTSGENLFYIGMIGFMVNGTMAALNMLPGGIFDGSKVFDWNKYIWGIVAAIAFALGLIAILLMF
jgi:Zn-dependent protease